MTNTHLSNDFNFHNTNCLFLSISSLSLSVYEVFISPFHRLYEIQGLLPHKYPREAGGAGGWGC